jgi:hypothetical protein
LRSGAQCRRVMRHLLATLLPRQAFLRRYAWHCLLVHHHLLVWWLLLRRKLLDTFEDVQALAAKAFE